MAFSIQLYDLGIGKSVDGPGVEQRIAVLALLSVLPNQRDVGRAQVGLAVVRDSQSLLESHRILRIGPSLPDPELCAVEEPQLVLSIDLEVEDHLPDVQIIVGDV